VTTLSAGRLLADPRGIVLDSRGNAYVADRCGVDLHPSIVRIDTRTGRQSLVARGGLLEKPREIAFRGRSLLVADENGFGGHGGVIRVDPVTGHQSRVSSGGYFLDPYGVGVGPHGEVYVAEQNDLTYDKGGVVQVNPATGDQKVLSVGKPFGNPEALTVAANGTIYVADGRGVVVEVNPRTGARRLVAEHGDLIDVEGIAIAPAAQLPPPRPGRVTAVDQPPILRRLSRRYYAGLPAHCIHRGVDTPSTRYRLTPHPRQVGYTEEGPDIKDHSWRNAPPTPHGPPPPPKDR
jgi:hypothetical protein